ncbi:MAG: cytidylate kinase [Firmicutes bacterium HGW-Firmicutes-11]|jgi:cytidylate kinase|nr:MAG: cytidylate kinase [Firmicutes bacterium HGW-Firmicutes-11]
MSEPIIVTIAREYGSGGSTIGRKLAEKLGCPFFDKELLAMAAKESGINEDLFQSLDEKPTSRFWDALPTGGSIYGSHHSSLGTLPIGDRLFLIQSEIIKKVAALGSCVIVGRCADFVLREDPHTIRVFVHSPTEAKLDRIIHSYHIPEEEARSVMEKIDKERSGYYSHHTQGRWGKAENYHLSVDSSVLGIDDTTDLLLYFARRKQSVGRSVL